MDAIQAREILQKLKELLDIGAITQKEFDSKEAELISQISFNPDNNNNQLQPLRQNQIQIQIPKDTINSMENLKKLKKAFDIGAITQKEFDSKKAKFMSQISFKESGERESLEVIDVIFISDQPDQKDNDQEDNIIDVDPIPKPINPEIDPDDESSLKNRKAYSEESFWSKITSVIKSAGIKVIYRALLLYYAMQNPECPFYIKGVIIAALGYFILPIDTVPDVIPFIGFSDDLIMIGAAIATASAFIDDNVRRKAREKIDELFGPGASAQLD